MPLASEVAAELRKIADALDKSPETVVEKPCLGFFYSTGTDQKNSFLNTARILPRPLNKRCPRDANKFSRVSVEHNTDALLISASIYRESICRIIKPAQDAEYDCTLTLLDEEDAALTETDAA